MRAMTKEFLTAAFSGESQAAMKYQIFSREADKKGLKNVARLFEAVAFAEYCHARNHLKALGKVADTADNLQVAIDGENFEVNEMYPAYNLVAEDQDETKAEQSTKWAMEAEKVHVELYTKAKNRVTSGKDSDVGKIWICEPCGWTLVGDKPPERCPLCGSLMERFVGF